jgi:hypothetical protein
MMGLLLNTATFVLLAAIAAHSILLHVRLRRFRHSLVDVGEMLLTLDASVVQMTEVSNGFSERLRTDVEAMDARVATARRLGVELDAAARIAATAATRLERLLHRQRQAEESGTVAALRARAEPKGFAERFGRSKPAASDDSVVPSDATDDARDHAPVLDDLQPVTA